jgi:hypothetical protein
LLANFIVHWILAHARNEICSDCGIDGQVKERLRGLGQFGDEGYVRQCHLLLLGLIDEFLFPDPHYFALLLLSFLFNFIKTLVCPWLLMTAKGPSHCRET